MRMKGEAFCSLVAFPAPPNSVSISLRRFGDCGGLRGDGGKGGRITSCFRKRARRHSGLKCHTRVRNRGNELGVTGHGLTGGVPRIP